MNFRKALPLCLTVLTALYSGAGAAMTSRHSQTTTLLPDGNILIAGGVTGAANVQTNSVQMYNMATNVYDAWGNLNTARSSHTATLLSDGRVLIAGGFDSSGTPMSSLEICSPISKTCSTAGLASLTTARGGHTATLLSKGQYAGQVLLCGGQTAASATSIAASCDRFDPAGNGTYANGAVYAAGSMISSRMGHAALLLKSGKIFVTGGRRRNAGNTAWVYEPMTEMYDPDQDAWTPKDALLQGRIDHTATVMNNGKIMIAGGYNGVNVLKCVNGVGEECWTEEDIKYWGVDNNQDWGSHGFLDGAEYFDQNGGRTVIAEASYGTAPYRVRQHSALLLPDGKWNMYGGYGGIVRTVFSAAPGLTEDTVFYLSRTGTNSADILPTSVIRFPIKAQMSRAISGRFVDADAYFAALPDGAESVSLDNGKIYLNHSTAALDGLPVGTLNGEETPGLFASTMTLTNPAGHAEFDDVIMASDYNQHANLKVVTSTITIAGGALFPTNSVTPNTPAQITGTVQGRVGFTLPKIYRGISAIAQIDGGTIIDPNDIYSIDIKTAGNAAISVTNPSVCDDNSCYFEAVTTFSVTGVISNLSEDTTVYSPLDAKPSGLTLTLTLSFTASEIHVLDTEPSFNYARSDIVVREMVFNSELGFDPANNAWNDLTDLDISPTLFTPVFNHATILTPGGDSVTLGGRNCETLPGTDCLRANKTFSSTAARIAFIPSYMGTNGNTNWTIGAPLNTKRAFHTSTLLRDGSILTCGGTDGIRMLSSCELMDPETKKWVETSSMTYARSKHTATLLPNGNVLVAGGVTASSSAVTYAEIYYPATRQWVATTPMKEPRNKHTATLLPDGNVLVTGGATISTYSATTEIYISSTAYWITTGALATARAQHTATLLRSGNVLLAGGVNGYGAVNTSEEYSYVTRAAVPAKTAVMTIGRYLHTANLLRDGRVLVAGGSNNYISQMTAEIYNGTGWTDVDTNLDPLLLVYNRAGHRSVLLPNGKLMITGGETAGAAQSRAEGYDPDFQYFGDQGATANRAFHTSVLTKDNYVLNIGGWDGSKYLNSTDMAYFSYSPDMYGLEADVQRQPVISTGTSFFNRGDSFTLKSDYANFHGISEASGGSAGPANSSQSNPRVYLQQIDNQSGFMIDITTRIYSHYGGLYGGSGSSWEMTLSSITITAPSLANEMPHGWYNIRVAENAQFSKGHTVQVTVPRPTGHTTVPTGTVLGTSSITWTWGQGSIGSADSYGVYAASNSVFITTVSFAATVSHTQAGLQANTATSIMVNGVNLGGDGPMTNSATYYTLAAPPASLTITTASFETVSLTWNPNGNSDATIYEISMSPDNFLDPIQITTPVPFAVGYTSTSTVIRSLSPNQIYYFRARAANGAGTRTVFGNTVSTITVGNITNLTGTAVSSTAINWSWDESPGASYYQLYDITDGTGPAHSVYLGSTTYNYFQQGGLLPNHSYMVQVNAAKSTAYGPVTGPESYSGDVYTLTVQPLPATPNVYTQVSTGSFSVNWISNGNSNWTIYEVWLSTGSTFASYTSSSTTGTSLTFRGLVPNTSYYTSVTPINGDGIRGTAVEMGYKYTLARAPENVAPLEISMSGISLGWSTNGNSSTTVYEVRGSTDNFSTSITTYVPFALAYTANNYQLSGLLTATTYYFDVAARNGDGYVTARIRAVPNPATLAGPSGAPSGSVGGTSDPSKSVTITGILPTGRSVAMNVPAGAFPNETAIAISSSAQNPCSYTVGGSPITVEVFSANSSQPQLPVTLTLNYTGSESAAAIDANRQRMVLARYNPLSGQCLPLETVIDPGARTIKATLNHFSLFQLMVRAAATNLSDVTVYPNPFYTNRGQGFVTIANMPSNAKVRIYTLSGEKVWEGTAGTTGILIWKGVNSSGYQVASGIYMAVVDSSAGKKVLKLAVER